MNYNSLYIEEMTAVVVLGIFNKNYAFGPKLETPFDVATTYVIWGFSFLALQILSFKRLFLNNLIFAVSKEININSRLCLILTTCAMTMDRLSRVMTFFASCEQFKYSIRFDRWNETNQYPNALHGQ